VQLLFAGMGFPELIAEIFIGLLETLAMTEVVAQASPTMSRRRLIAPSKRARSLLNFRSCGVLLYCCGVRTQHALDSSRGDAMAFCNLAKTLSLAAVSLDGGVVQFQWMAPM